MLIQVVIMKLLFPSFDCFFPREYDMSQGRGQDMQTSYLTMKKQSLKKMWFKQKPQLSNGPFNKAVCTFMGAV